MSFPMTGAAPRYVPPSQIVWRLSNQSFAADWEKGEGARLFGGRWNHKGRSVVYASGDPATALLEVGVHVGLPALSNKPHVKTAFSINEMADLHIVWPSDIPDPSWLTRAPPTDDQRDFAHDLLDTYAFIALPSVVTKYSWNVIFDPNSPAFLKSAKWDHLHTELYDLDTRLTPAKP
jgi:RES domain-containing protein